MLVCDLLTELVMFKQELVDSSLLTDFDIVVIHAGNKRIFVLSNIHDPKCHYVHNLAGIEVD